MPPNTPDRENIRRLSTLLTTAFLIVALALFFWSMIRAGTILARDDNPRLVEEEFRIQRGTIFDRNGLILAESMGQDGRQRRSYPNPQIGPSVGYYSLTYGTTGVENVFDTILRGEDIGEAASYWNKAFHLPPTGLDIQLALDANLQETSQDLMAGQDGAVLLLDLPHEDSERAWIRVLSSNPGYDPNLIDNQFEEHGLNESAPLLNRVTQGQYQPGLLLQPLILASAVEQGIIQINDPVADPQQPVTINGESIQCASSPPTPTSWVGVLQHGCPGPMQDLADQMGSGGLDAAFSAFGLDRDPTLEIDTTTTPDEPLTDPLLAGIGQDNLSITPLKIGLAMSALLGQGSIPQPQVAEALLTRDGEWEELIQETESQQAISKETAQLIRQAFPLYGNIHEFNPLVVSGPKGSTNAWYIGMVSGETADQLVIVVLEGSNEPSAAKRIGQGVLAADN